MTTLETRRLISRPWQQADVEPFFALSSDPEVMRFFGGPQPRETVEAVVKTAMERQRDFGVWFQPLILKETGAFIGITGIAKVLFEAPFTPAVEIGWRLDPAHWGQGLVTEIGRAFIDYAFMERGFDELVSFAVHDNERSIAVMKRLGFTHDRGDDFDHPRVPDDLSHLKRHVLYRLRNGAGKG
ncbi:Protein N-acetyltransferase, RimJ/RimL family [Fulvimarina manganoxydans]|uniref:Protein N-acetyltransferase, RimJ/RimL family n=1 Tax=Fulvimarina manganoxydans TaxID=937218 RepID=A0A1W2DW78_9HYPH|nr:GNAT family N-acetyltransferase [Fulvimarina manganoxydans]SMD01761.1 Protein N-acetyltransferase, RimJ/RimL family [Fulvimarina manganoxydans]